MLRSFYHWLLAFLGTIIFWFPSRYLVVVGVTGTKGKSTVVELMSAILEASGKRTSILSSIRRKVGSKEAPNVSGNTMPGRFSIQKFLREAVRAGSEYALIETTSQGIMQHRHRFIEWDAAVFINLTPEHIESHGSFEAYRDAKVEFFRSLAKSKKPKKLFFVNEDDDNHHYFEDSVKNLPDSKLIFFSRSRFIKEELGGHYDVRSKKGGQVVADWLLADFNLENAAAAVAFARSQGVGWQDIKRALDNFRGVPGRLEFVQKTPFAVIVDYAHTPDSLEKIYKTLQPEALHPHAAGEMICVLGAAGGGRDKWKRPEMGRIAATYCDKIVLTTEDPYNEDPGEIVKQIENGFLKAEKARARPQNYWSILERRAAIQKAFSLAKKGDVVILTGKGSEQWIHIENGKKLPWNERKVAEEELLARMVIKKPG